MSWSHFIRHYVTIDQNTRDPWSPDHSVNCGPAATCSMGRWITGRHFDPEEVRIAAGDATGDDTGTGPEIDRWFFGHNGGPVPAPLIVAQPQSEDELAWHVWKALMHGHLTKILQVYDAPDSEWHFRVIHASWQPHGRERVYALGDPWTGQTVVQTKSMMADMYRGLIIIPQRSRHV